MSDHNEPKKIKLNFTPSVIDSTVQRHLLQHHRKEPCCPKCGADAMDAHVIPDSRMFCCGSCSELFEVFYSEPWDVYASVPMSMMN